MILRGARQVGKTTLGNELFLASDIQDVYKGRIAEHIVGQELIGMSHHLDARRYFWQKTMKNHTKNDDFFVETEKQSIFARFLVERKPNMR